MITSDESIRVSLVPLFERAESQGLWFYHNSLAGEVWFHPEELKEHQEKGHYLWGAENWELRDPAERLKALRENVVFAQEQVTIFSERMKAHQ